MLHKDERSKLKHGSEVNTSSSCQTSTHLLINDSVSAQTENCFLSTFLVHLSKFHFASSSTEPCLQRRQKAAFKNGGVKFPSVAFPHNIL